MPTSEHHLRQAEHNESLVQLLRDGGPEHCDWAVTAFFYAALHYLTALLHRRGCSDSDVVGHGRRFDELVKRFPRERPLLAVYLALKDDSEEGRYDCRRFSREELAESEQQFSMLKGRALELLA